LFVPGVAFALVCLFVVLDAMVATEIWRHGMADFGEASLAGALALVIAGVAVHELGHLSACSRYGAAHGGIGIGVYWCLPVFYAEVHGAWLLTRPQRAVVDIGGIYFQCLFLLGAAAAWLVYPSATLLLALWASHVLVLNTLNPVLKYDGYWLLSDLSGRHNLHEHIRESAKSCWRALVGHAGTPWPPAQDRMLLGLFLALAVAYFAYVLHFIAHNLAYASSRLLDSQPGWRHAVTALGLTLTVAFAMGVSVMLARAIRGVVTIEPTNGNEWRHGAR
jgi:putative peptide zinc metalloprotease protein